MAVEKTDEPEIEETHFDRKRKYRELIAKGVGDKEAVEAVWPSSSARIAQNAKDKADGKAAEKKKKE
ncbi:Uncharacterised protein [uncultured archaeon]|nr:Uncharacterised protein [uncultured archaeon]